MENNIGKELYERKNDYTYLRKENGELDICEISRTLKEQSYNLAKKEKPED